MMKRSLQGASCEGKCMALVGWIRVRVPNGRAWCEPGLNLPSEIPLLQVQTTLSVVEEERDRFMAKLLSEEKSRKSLEGDLFELKT